ncbi:MAG: outer membrane beta-barrel protein [bacterium]
MRRSSLAAALLLAMGMFAPASAAHAQRPFTFGFGGGAAMPLGSSGDQLVLGWNALGTMNIQAPVLPVGVRLDVAYNEFNFERALLGSANPPGSQRITSFSVNPTLRLPTTGQSASPYAIGGVGSYNVGCTDSGACKSSSKIGWNVGVGASFQTFGLKAFAEARYHRVQPGSVSLQYVPFTLGLLF